MAFRIAYCAGHYLNTPGKRVPKELDKACTREWVLNDRVADYFAQAAAEYPEVMLLRTDDPVGLAEISIKKRTQKANTWGADLYLDLHHNAGINLGKGGGVVVYCKKKDTAGRKFRDEIYRAVIAAGKLRGNRANPLAEKNYLTMVYSKATAVLIEFGFMDSRADYPVISTEEYAKKVAYATMEAIAAVANLEKTKKETCKVELRILKNGASGKDVKAMQILLEASGCKGKMDAKKYGSFGSKTEEAVKLYQKKAGILQTGCCDAATWGKLLGG